MLLPSAPQLMVQQATTIKAEEDAGSFYDRIARLYDLTFKFNGYRRALTRYFRDRHVPLTPGMRVLDAGCGTGLLTLSLLEALERPRCLAAVDLSRSSLLTARKSSTEVDRKQKTEPGFAQANVLTLPFADQTFDLVVTSGVLEYVPLSEGFRELARVTRPQGYLLYLPVRPSPASKLLEAMFRFKTRPPHKFAESTRQHFHIISDYRFPIYEPIGWTKRAVLAQKQ